MEVKYDDEVRYAATHEWVRVEGDLAVLGISDYAQDQLSDVVYVELPEVGDTFGKGESCGVVESVKAASDIYMPVGGEVVELNEALEDSPQIVNEDAFGAGWFFRFRPSDMTELESLMGVQEYRQFCAEEAERGGH